MSDPVLQAPQKTSFYLIEFRYGDRESPSYERITDDLVDYVLPDGTVYSSISATEITFGRQSGTLEEGETEIKLKIQGEFLTAIMKGEPFSRIDVRIHEILRSDGIQSKLTLFVGKVWSTTKNYQGQKNRGIIRCRSWKSFLDVPLGITVRGRCPWIFGDDNCRFNVRNKGEVGTIQKISGLRITISGLDDHPKYWWKKGYIEKDGLRIPIKNWSGQKTFVTTKIPPQSWLEEEVTVYPGCDKKYVTCEKWGQNHRFAGIGKRMPMHHTVYEGGDG